MKNIPVQVLFSFDLPPAGQSVDLELASSHTQSRLPFKNKNNTKVISVLVSRHD